MNLFRRSAAGTTQLSPVAAFAGVGAGLAAAKPKNDDDATMTDEEKAAKAAADDKKKADDEEAARQAAAASKTRTSENNNDEEDDDDGGDEDGDDETDDRDMRKGSKSKACRARRRERARIATILSHPSAADNLNFAVFAAIKTNMTRSEAVAMLEKAPKPGALNSLSSRMAGAQPAPPAADGTSHTPADRAKAVVAEVFGPARTA